MLSRVHHGFFLLFSLCIGSNRVTGIPQRGFANFESLVRQGDGSLKATVSFTDGSPKMNKAEWKLPDGRTVNALNYGRFGDYEVGSSGVSRVLSAFLLLQNKP